MQTSIQKRFGNRQDAGRALAQRLAEYSGAKETVVLAFPKGGIAVGSEIAKLLNLPFDVLLIDRITAPGCGEAQLGAITSGGVRILNSAMIDRLNLSDDVVRGAVLRKALRLARRERLYRRYHASVDLADRTVILVDDGTTSCSNLRNAIRLLRRQHVEHVVVAVPITCRPDACDLRMEADAVVTLEEPVVELPVATWFESFPSTTASEVRRLLGQDLADRHN